jgi:Flp pilus assembly protein TadD
MTVIVVYILGTMMPKLLPLRAIASGFFLLLLPFWAAAADNWIEVRSAHFTVSSNASEREARKVAGQFEQIRTMFHTAFPTFRVDPAQPISILAVKNENTLKLFLPEEYEVKGHIHHAGMYQPGEDKDYVVLRLDSEGDNPFHTLYHEYTHALMRLNFRSLPVWLNEGLAEFFGNSTLGDKETRTGTIDPGHLYLLNQNKLIPIETLLEVDHNSPYYNEKNRASVFYAESWALVHYLMMDPEARQKQFLKTFLSAWEKSDDQVAAAREAFGDLKRFGQNIESYARQASFHIGLVKVGQEASDKNYASRSVSAGEALALRGDFFTHHNRIDQAQPTLEEAVRTAPNLPFAHEALGFYHYRRHEIKEADKEMMEAMKLGATDFIPAFFHGVLLMQGEGFDSETAQEAKTSLEKAVQLNPQFAPAYERLAQAYSRSPETQKQAVNAAIKAVQLDPATLSYSTNLAYLLVNSNRLPEARTMAQRILAAATSPGEKEIANNLLRNVQQAEEWAAKRPNDGADSTMQSDTTSANFTTGAGPAGTAKSEASEEVPVQLKHRMYGIDGPISSVECSKKPEVTINVKLSSGPVSFHTTDFGKVSLSWADEVAEPSLSNCTQWKGRKIKVWFSPTPGREYAGEITKLFFF